MQRTSAPATREAVVAVWGSSATCTNRVKLLRDTGYAGGIKLTPSSTAFIDSEIDLMIGDANLVWFFASSNELNLALSGDYNPEPNELRLNSSGLFPGTPFLEFCLILVVQALECVRQAPLRIDETGG